MTLFTDEVSSQDPHLPRRRQVCTVWVLRYSWRVWQHQATVDHKVRADVGDWVVRLGLNQIKTGPGIKFTQQYSRRWGLLEKRPFFEEARRCPWELKSTLHGFPNITMWLRIVVEERGWSYVVRSYF
jgi:hypothetical protein